MPNLFAFATPLALLLPIFGQGGEQSQEVRLSGAGSPAMEAAATEGRSSRQVTLTTPRYPSSLAPANALDAFHDGQRIGQIRIERRVIVRISPRRSRNQNQLLARLPQQGSNSRYEERKMDKCVPVSDISAVQTGSGNRLLLFMRDSRIVSANLEKACRARDFYSGFYVEKSEDGKLCVDRDKLQSRSGAKCEVERLRQLVVVEK